MAGFLEHLQGKYEEGKAKSNQAFITKAVTRILAAFDVTLSPGVARDVEFGFGWFMQEYPTFPVSLDGRNVKIDVTKMFKAMHKTPAWEVLMNHLEALDGHTGGVIIPAHSVGLAIAHNWWSIPDVPGFTRLVRRARRESDGIIFEPLESFIEGVKLSGWTP